MSAENTVITTNSSTGREKKERLVIKKRSQFKSIWFRFRKNKLAVIGMVLLSSIIFVAIFADLIANYEERVISQNIQQRLQTPSREHIFGTDHVGRDIFARIVHGSRVSISLGLLTVAFALTIGAIIGSVSGYYGGIIDNTLMRIMDVILAVPNILMAISIVAALGPGMRNLLIAMSLAQIPTYARIVRASILSIMGQEFIEAAKACGTRDRRIIFRHILPNAIGPIIVQSTLGMASIILTISALSFVGLGIEPPMPEWGSMLSEGRVHMRNYPHLVVIPGLAIVFAVLSLNLIGDGLRDALDPKLKN
jgi:peptide/nickel transport system permease protein